MLEPFLWVQLNHELRYLHKLIPLQHQASNKGYW